ncbi:MAG: IPTL-CTERM sorting domain-containing protein [Candidatus Zixiibacteriota bacterium]|nr:MAG: IPTL-CTERM sorting domain-containing protein [candidate division Zixibacteria bacterium]
MRSNLSTICLLAIILSLVLFYGESVFAQQSTTGPVPPIGIERGIKPPTRLQTTIPNVPSYIWHHGCGPTALGMVVGYWDGNGYPNLVPGDASSQTAAVDAMIADDSGNPNCSLPDGDHFQDYSCPIDTFPNMKTDRSVTGGAHTSDCVADFMETSWSSVSNYYGWSWFSDVAPSFINYVNFTDPTYGPAATGHRYHQFTFANYMAEIDAGRPVVLLVDTDGDGDTDHFVTGIGYDNSTNEYGIYNTWDHSIHWFSWRYTGNFWGIYGVITFSLEPGAIPTLSEWGMLIMALLLLAAGTVGAIRKRTIVAAAKSR